MPEIPYSHRRALFPSAVSLVRRAAGCISSGFPELVRPPPSPLITPSTPSREEMVQPSESQQSECTFARERRKQYASWSGKEREIKHSVGKVSFQRPLSLSDLEPPSPPHPRHPLAVHHFAALSISAELRGPRPGARRGRGRTMPARGARKMERFRIDSGRRKSTKSYSQRHTFRSRRAPSASSCLLRVLFLEIERKGTYPYVLARVYMLRIFILRIYVCECVCICNNSM